MALPTCRFAAGWTRLDVYWTFTVAMGGDVSDVAYAEFLEQKRRVPAARRVPIAEIPDGLFPFQREIVEWTCARGRAAIFADCGLGKTPMQLAWAANVAHHTDRPVLILAPLAVSDQTVREGKKFGIEVAHLRDPSDGTAAPIIVTNYERLERFADVDWGGVVLDESSILKAFDGKTRERLIAFAARIEHRLCCTATPSPNDYEELGGHSAFLGQLSQKQMLAEFFINDGLSAAHWRLKGYGEKAFWRWIVGWARAARSPADLGYPDDGFALPALNVKIHHVDADTVSQEHLFPVPVSTMQERREARRESISERVAITAAAANSDSSEPWVVWCDLNAESAALAAAIPDAVEVKGSDPADVKEDRLRAFSEGRARVIVSKPSIAGWGLNWQHCARVAFVGLSDSYEQYYQAVRRCWRFGQTRPVDVLVVASNREQAVLDNIRRKESQARSMFADVVKTMRESAT